MSKRHRAGRQDTLHQALGTEPATSLGTRVVRHAAAVGGNEVDSTPATEQGDGAGVDLVALSALAVNGAGLAGLEYLAAVQSEADRLVKVHVQAARRHRASWTEIADALGLASKQTAWARYGGH